MLARLSAQLSYMTHQKLLALSLGLRFNSKLECVFPHLYTMLFSLNNYLFSMNSPIVKFHLFNLYQLDTQLICRLTLEVHFLPMFLLSIRYTLELIYHTSIWYKNFYLNHYCKQRLFSIQLFIEGELLSDPKVPCMKSSRSWPEILQTQKPAA